MRAGPSASVSSQDLDKFVRERNERHERQFLRSRHNLDHARRSRLPSPSDARELRSKLERTFRDAFGFIPRDWQLDIAEALTLGLDVVAIAGTGSGKTNPFMLLPLAHPGKKIIVISPLKMLQYDQQRRFTKAGIRAEAVNGDTWGAQLREKLVRGEVDAILTSPEMCLEVQDFRKILLSEDFRKDVAAVVIDEAHCVEQWSDFRNHYKHLGKLRSLYPNNVPFLATSATLPPETLTRVCNDLHIELADAFFVNLGNDRPNITPHVHQIRNAHDYAALKSLLPLDACGPEDMEKTIIFFNDVKASQKACRKLRELFPKHLRNYVDYLHARRAASAKRRVMRRFRSNKIKILIATEAAGMGADIPDIKVVIQFGVPSSLSVWGQRAGRAGRSPYIHADAHLLYEKSVFERKRKKRRKGAGGEEEVEAESVVEVDDLVEESSDDDEDMGDGSESDSSESDIDAGMVALAALELSEGKEIGDGKEWVKSVQPELRFYLGTRRCRRDVLDEYFDNPVERQAPTGPCCDNCERSTAQVAPARPSTPPQPSAPDTDDNALSPQTTPSREKNTNGKRPMTARAATGPTRRGDKRRPYLEALSSWRQNLKNSERFCMSNMSCEDILPEQTMKQLASRKNIRSAEDIYALKPPWILARLFAQEVLDVLRRTEAQITEQATRDKALKAATSTMSHRPAKRPRNDLGQASLQAHAPTPGPNGQLFYSYVALPYSSYNTVSHYYTAPSFTPPPPFNSSSTPSHNSPTRN
ncbi:P-loop containing nucleoside triphosphate hydrolase protein [Schizophyllum commune]